MSPKEECNTELEAMLCQMKQAQEFTQTKVTDLELQFRRNNICIYGIPEGKEDKNMMDFVAKFLQSEFTLDRTELRMHRCHKALSRRPPCVVPPRSIVINVQECKTKDQILSTHGKRSRFITKIKKKNLF